MSSRSALRAAVLLVIVLLAGFGPRASSPSRAQTRPAFPALSASSSSTAAHHPVRLARVALPRRSDRLTLQRLGLDIIERGPGVALVAATDDEISRLEHEGFQVSVIELDVESATRRQLGIGMASYHTFEEVVAELDRLAEARPDLVAPRIAIGTSWEGRPLWAVKISDHPEVDEDEPEVLYDALHHAREPVGMETLLHVMEHLVQNYDSDSKVRALVDERELWFIPVVNPDGYVWGGIGGMWRKNRRPNPDGSFGVDLNRNYGYQWGYDNMGSSPTPSSQTYRGPAPFSEPETAALRDFVLRRRFVTGMTLHSYSEVNLLPDGWDEVRSGDAETFEEIAHELETLNGYPHGQPWELLYFSNGRTQDWMVHEAGMVVIEPEIGSVADGFWPPGARVRALAEQNLPAVLHMAVIAGACIEAGEIEVDDGIAGALENLRSTAGQPELNGDCDGVAEPGETVDLILSLRNKGFEDAEGIELSVTCSTPMLSVHGAGRDSLTIGSLPARTTRRLDGFPVRVSLGPDAIHGKPIPLTLALSGERMFRAQVTVELIPGNPRLIFADDAESGPDQWTTTQSWGITPVPGGNAFTDSPQGSYRPSTDNALVMARPIDLSGATRVELRYREILNIEPWDDLCHVEAQSLGQGWRPLLTLPGGVESTFRERRLSLDAFAGAEQVELRFRLISDHANQREGWTIDDIKVWAYGGVDSAGVLAAAPPVPSNPRPVPTPTVHPGAAAAE